MSRKKRHLSDDLLEARERSPHDPHLQAAVVAYLSHAKPECRDPQHPLCQRVRSAVDDHVRRDRG